MGNQIAQQEQQENEIIKDFLKKNKYLYQQLLEKEHFSQVVKAFSEKQQCLVAIKIFKQIKGQSEINLQEFENEINILQKLKNEKYVLQIVEKFQDDKLGLTAIVTELCDCSLKTIFDLNQFDYEQILAITYQLLKGLLVFQEKDIIHSNIKPSNILFSKQKNQFLIAGYGQSTINIAANPSSQKNMTLAEGNLCYKSPEVINQQKPYAVNVDVFSIGQILTEVFLKRRLTLMEQEGLKKQSLFVVIPSLKNSQFKFVNEILSKMVEPNKDLRLQPMNLLQNLNSYKINEDSLMDLRLQKKLRRICINTIDEIVKAKDYDIVEIKFFYWYRFGAQEAKDIGMSLEKCQNISSLNLNLCENIIGAKGAKSLGMSLEKCQNISSLNLNLGNNKIGAEGAKSIGISLEKCQNISSLNLDLSWNQLGVEGANSIGISLVKCQNISSLDLNLDLNQLGIEGANNIVKCLVKCQNINYLNLNLCKNLLDIEAVKNIGIGLEKCQNISSLGLSLQNNINDEGAKNIGMSLEKCQNIHFLNLNLSNNDLSESGAKYIGMSLEKCQNISSLNLNLGNNQIGAEGAKNIGVSLEKCPNISSLSLNLHRNTLGEVGAKNIGISLEKCQNIIFLNLNLSENDLDANGVEIIGMSLERCQKISFLNLDLSNNRFGEKGALNIGMSLEKCKKINSLILCFRKIQLDGQKNKIMKSLKKTNKYLVKLKTI